MVSFLKLLNFVRPRGEALAGSPLLKALLWIKPYTEKVTRDLEQFIKDNRDYIAGLKMHPSLSGIKLTDDRFTPYLELAASFNLPVQVHTENDGLSNVNYVEDIAATYRDTDFVMVHMGLNTGNGDAMNIIKKYDNVYGDTCEVKHDNVIRAIRECGPDKILFGTDAIVHGIDTYARYMPLLELIRSNFSREEADNVLFRNCRRVFHV
ncbi:MAG: amidohydrolase family protein [Bacteroidales bacterium]|nr:amidohydrolase family protein [Bacteroidales bacterium]